MTTRNAYRVGSNATPQALAELAERRRHPRRLVGPTATETAALLERYKRAGLITFPVWFLSTLMLGSVISPIVTAIGSGRRRSDFDMHIFVICFLCVALITAVLCFINYCQWPRESARRVRELLAETPREGYPIDGFAVWRLAGRPALDVVLRGFVDCDDIRDALAVIDPTVELSWPDATTMRLVMPEHTNPFERRPEQLAALHVLLDELVAPLHHEVGVERVVMGDLAVQPRG